MARSLSATLEEAQKYGLLRWPYLIAKIRRKWGGVIRYDFENLYSGGGYDGPHCSAMPSDGSLIRLRVTESGDSRKLYYQRVADPGEESNFSSWTYLSIYDVIDVASCAYGQYVFQCYINLDRKLYYRESDDNGASWGSWTLKEYTPSTDIRGLACAYKPNGDLVMAYLDQDTFYLWRRVSDSWQSQVTCPNSLDDKTGLAAYYYEDWNFVVTTSPDVIGGGVYTCIYGDGGRQAAQTWSLWESILLRGSTEPYSYRSPFIGHPDTTRLFFVEEFTQATETDHVFYSQIPPASHFDDVAWLEPVPMEPETTFGLAFCQSGSYAWLTNANSVYRALATDNELDITDKLLKMDMRQYPDIRKGYVRIDIDNTGGIYNDIDRLGDELTIGLGFVTEAGNEYSLTSSFWITKQKKVSPSWSIWRSIYPSGVLGVINMEAQDAWDFLKRYKSRRALSWEADDKSVKQLLQYFFARAGLDFEVISESSAVQNFKPAFEVSKNTSYSVIIRNLLRMVPDQVFFRESKAMLRNPTTAESVDWTYHNLIGTAILVFRGKYGESGQDPNRAEVWGDTFMAQDADYSQIKRLRDRGKIITTPDYPDVTRAGERAAAEMRRAEILTSEESWMQTTVNCGLEPWDKLGITDQISGVTDISRRAIRIQTIWDKLSWNYQQRLIMGAD